MVYLIIIIVELFLDLKQIRYILQDQDTKDLFLKIWNYIKDWRTALSFFIAWNITNGWSYVFVILGSWLKIKWMRTVGISYLSLLWAAVPEKYITIPLGMGIKKILFRRHKKGRVTK